MRVDGRCLFMTRAPSCKLGLLIDDIYLDLDVTIWIVRRVELICNRMYTMCSELCVIGKVLAMFGPTSKQYLVLFLLHFTVLCTTVDICNKPWSDASVYSTCEIHCSCKNQVSSVVNVH